MRRPVARGLHRLHPGAALLAQAQRHLGPVEAPVGGVEVRRLQAHALAAAAGLGLDLPEAITGDREFQFGFKHRELLFVRGLRTARRAGPPAGPPQPRSVARPLPDSDMPRTVHCIQPLPRR